MKSYFAPTVQDALEQARLEMGPEALLIHSRKAPPEAQGLGEYEVVFAILPEGANGPPRPATTETPDRGEKAADDPVLRELMRLRKQVEEMGGALNGINAHAASWAVPTPEFAEVFSCLMENDFSLAVARKIVKQAHARLDADPGTWSRRKTFGRDAIEEAVRTELGFLISAGASLQTSGEAPRVVALVGPPGTGKTTTLVKLAVRYGLALSRPVQMVCAEAHRVGAAEQLRTYATIVGAGFDAVETTRGLRQAMEEHREKGLVLIDTPGYAAKEMEDAAELARVLSHLPGVETHLVASASMRAADLSRAIDRFEIFAPAKLIFTRLDETLSFGAMVSESVRTGKPISFLGTGQEIPEGLEPATPERVLDLALERMSERALSAA